jgi:hypothetical protein
VSFSNPFATKTDDVSTLTALEINTAGANIASAFDTTGANTVVGATTFSGTQSVTGLVTYSGTNGRQLIRIDSSTLGDANATVDVSKDLWACDVAVLSLRTWTLRHSTAPTPSAGDTIMITKVGGGGSSVDVKREDATIVASFGTGAGSLTVVYRGGAWRGLDGDSVTHGAGW